MKSFRKSALAAAVAAASVAVTAAEQTGTLTVTTTIAASCEAPSPASNLVLPFSGSSSLTGDMQSVSSGVEVTVSCTGNPTIQKVAFDSGSSVATAPSGRNGSDIRLMQRTGTDGNADTDFLGYKLHANNSNIAPSDGNNNLMGTTASNNTLTLNDQGSSSFYVHGRIYEEDNSVWANGAAVVGGTYRDTVTMTITY